MKKREFNKIFCIGFNKTGTFTIDKIFSDLGFKTLHQGCGWDRVPCPHYKRFNTEFWGDGNQDLIDQHTVFSDGENHNFEKLDKLYPNSKFILNTRNLEEWLLSRLKHRGKLFTKELIKLSVLKRKEYYNYIFEYFKDRKDDLLVLNVSNDKELLSKISNFFNVIIPENYDIPKINIRDNREYNIKKYLKIILKVLRKLKIKDIHSEL